MAYGLTLSSTIALPELPAREGIEAQLSVTLSEVTDDTSASPPEGGVTVDRTADGIRLRFPGLVDFVLSDDCSRIEAWPRAGVPESTVRHLLIDHVVPSALGAQGDLVLHASGISLPQGAVLFLGHSGAGKSTLAAALSRRRWPALCDDAARVVEGGSRFAVFPSYPGLRLWPDGVAMLVGSEECLGEVAHNSTKSRWVPGGTAPAPVPLACVFVLDDSDEAVEIAPMSSREAVVDVLDVSYRLPGCGPDPVRSHFDRVTRLVMSRPFYRLAYPYDFSRLDEVADLVEATAASADRRSVLAQGAGAPGPVEGGPEDHQ